MNTGGYVQCRGCGGWLPPGALCGYCYQRQTGAAPQPRRLPKAKAVTMGLLAVALVGAAAAGLLTLRLRPSRNFAQPGAEQRAIATTLSPQQSSAVIAALGSGDTHQTLAALQAQGSSQQPTVLAGSGAEAPAAILQTSNPAPSAGLLEVKSGSMPEDVRRWLEHLQKIEAARIALATGEVQDAAQTLIGLQAGDIGHALGEDGEDDSVAAEKTRANDRAQRVATDMQTMQQSWRTLQSAFDAVVAPAECVAIKSNYDQVIGQTGAMIMEIVGTMKSAQDDPQSAVKVLTSMQGQSKSRIDVPARAADGGVADICRRYDTAKWFDIQNDVGSGVMGHLGF